MPFMTFHFFLFLPLPRFPILPFRIDLSTFALSILDNILVYRLIFGWHLLCLNWSSLKFSPSPTHPLEFRSLPPVSYTTPLSDSDKSLFGESFWDGICDVCIFSEIPASEFCLPSLLKYPPILTPSLLLVGEGGSHTLSNHTLLRVWTLSHC